MTGASATQAILEADHLAAVRGRTRLFADVALRVGAREALFVTGPNGSGKTTLLRILAGLTAPSAGSVRFRGEIAAPFDARRRESVAFTGHLPALKDELSAAENLAAQIALAGASASGEEISAALERVQLSRQRTLPARVLSQGQRRRIGLARLTLANKPLWLLDEPATALDAEGIELLTSLIRRHLDADGCAIVATHQRLDIPRATTLSLA
jgi:heme exporter protein A